MSLFTSPSKGIVTLFAVAAIPLSFLFMSFGSGDGDDGLKIGKQMPMADRAMPGVDNTSKTLKDFMGENGLIVIFSCNTCPFVVGNDDFPGWERQYNTLFESASGHKIGMVLVNSNEAKRGGDDSMDQMKLHARDAGYKAPYVVDENHELADAVGAKTTPHVYVFDKEQRLVYKGSIDNSWDSKRESDEHYLMEVIEHLDGGKKIKENSTPPRGCSIKRVSSK